MPTDAQNSVSPATKYFTPLFVKYGIDVNTQQPLDHLLSNVNESEFYGLFRLCNESVDTINDAWYLRSAEILKLYAKIVVALRDNTEFILNSKFLIESFDQFPETLILFFTSLTKANLDLKPVVELCKISPITLIGSNQISFKETAEILNKDFGYTMIMFLREFNNVKYFMEYKFNNVLES